MGENVKFVIGSRESQLAMVQTTHVLNILKDLNPDISFSILGMTTLGDNVLDVALSKIGSKSLFTKELEVALYEKSVDLVVHSLKDMPTTLPPGMTIGAILEREDPRDAVVMKAKWKGKRLQDLPDGSVIGTSSVRRSAQLKKTFPTFQFKDVRGNLNTRLRKLDDENGPYDALLLAYAGLHRLGWDDRVSEVLNPDTLLHAVGQGALGIECRDDDEAVLDLLKVIDHPETRFRCTAERAFMKELEGGCSVPLGVWTNILSEKTQLNLEIRGSVTSLDGTIQFVGAESGSVSDLASLHEAEDLGKRLARNLVAQGADKILDELKAARS
ncbi:hypothetical protein HK098_000312 [Nowakowskiella sp. JEL0407]|nr:hypothetical protein HK098_000312 [Nowakowskiella sp. JEL0407]